MRVSSGGRAVAADIIREWEKLRLHAYDDATGRDIQAGERPQGIVTIGYGHVKTAKAGMVITEAEAENLLTDDMADAIAAIRRFVKAPLNANQEGAAISLAFNIGGTAFGKSTALKLVNAERHDEVPAAIKMWNKVTVGGKKIVSKGLKRRRDHEAFVYARPVAPVPKSLTKSRTLAGSYIGSTGTLGGGSIEAVQEVLGEAQGPLSDLALYLDVAKYLLLAVALVGLGLVIYARLSDRKGGLA
jgi:lysozyme